MKNICLVVCLSIFTGTINAQNFDSFVGKSLQQLQQINDTTSQRLFGSFRLFFPQTPKKETSTKQFLLSKSQPLIYRYEELALFCKLEVQMEKVAKMPIKVRLGSVDYVDWLEGKRDDY